jgi:hypothetical protein
MVQVPHDNMLFFVGAISFFPYCTPTINQVEQHSMDFCSYLLPKNCIVHSVTISISLQMAESNAAIHLLWFVFCLNSL